MTEREWIRPQSFVMSLLGNHALDKPIAIAMTSYVEVCGRIGVSEEATRSTLARMRTRGLLRSERRGRHAYLALTDLGEEVLRDGRARLETPVAAQWDGHWTLVAVTLPTSNEAERHSLRSRLLWAGFGGLNNGLWIVPRRVDVAELTAGLVPDSSIRAFGAELLEPTTPQQIITDGYDFASIEARYERFLRRWQQPEAVGDSPLIQQLLLYTDWLLVIRENPRLPIEFLPGDWPGFEAEEKFRNLADSLLDPAAAEASEALEIVEATDVAEVSA